MMMMFVVCVLLVCVEMCVGSNVSCSLFEEDPVFMVTLVGPCVMSSLTFIVGFALLMVAWRVQKNQMGLIRGKMHEIMELVIHDIFPGKVPDQLISQSKAGSQKTSQPKSAASSSGDHSKSTKETKSQKDKKGEGLYDNIG